MLKRLRELWDRMGASVSRNAVATELDEELRFHLEMMIERNLARGMSPDAARRDALLRFGSVERAREETWDEQRPRWLEDALQDVRHAVRMLRWNPLFALAAIATLALGVGANTAIFSVLDAVLLRPLPYAAPEELVAFHPSRYENYRAWTERARALEASGAYTYSLANVTGGTEPARVWTLAVTSTLLPTLGVTPLLGSNFSTIDDAPNSPPRVLLRHGFWQTHFGGDRSLVGRTIDLSGLAHEVIGILPAELEFPPPARRSDGSMPTRADVWIGAGRLPDLFERGGFFAIARLRPGATAEAAAAELTAVANSLRPSVSEPMRVEVQRLDESVVAPLRAAVLAFTGAVALVLLIACANLGSLLLARLAGRQRELALRVALGASSGRIVRQILTEGAVLAFGGAIAGLAVAWLVLHTLLGLAPPELARVQQATLSGRALAFTLTLSVVTALLIGLLPSLRALRHDPRESLGSTRGATVDRSTGRMHAILIACEMAFAVVLLIGGGLLLRSFSTLAGVTPGFPARGLVTADLLVPPDRYQTRAATLLFLDRIEQQIGALPGVRSVSGIDRLPYGASFSGIGFTIIGRPQPEVSSRPRGMNTAARPAYFRTMGIPLVQGREFTSADATDAPPVVVISRTLAERYWPGGSPLGVRIEVFGVEREIVGVASDVRHYGPTTPVDPLIYLPQAQDITTRRMMTVVIRTDGSSAALLGAVRASIRALDSQLPISNLRSFDTLRSERTANQRFNALLVGSFAALAVLLAAVGIYGVMSFVVAQRKREIGVRLALGASPGMVRRAFVRQAMRGVCIGALVGVAIALPLTQFTRAMLFGIEPTDALTYAAVLILVITIGLCAAWLPAHRLAGVQPNAALAGE